MITFQILCVVSLTIGAIAFFKESGISATTGQVTEKRPEKKRVTLGPVEMVYVMLSALMIVLYIIKVFARASMDYNDFFYGETSGTGVDIRIAILFYGFLYTSYYNHLNDKFSYYIYGSSALLCVLMLLIGSRSLMIPIIFGLLFVKTVLCESHIKIRWQSVVKILVLSIFLLYILQAFKILRGYSIGDINASILLDAFGVGIGEGLVNIFAEMGGSARCVLETIREIDSGSVDNVHTFSYHLLKMFVPVDIINYFGISINIKSLSMWVTEVGGGLKGTASWGYSIIGEAYMNFGWWGFIAMFIFGALWMLANRFVVFLIKKDHKVSAMCIVYLMAYSIFLARAETSLISSIGRYAFYILIISVLVRDILRLKNPVKIVVKI